MALSFSCFQIPLSTTTLVSRAADSYRLASDLGHIQAVASLGELYYMRGHGVRREVFQSSKLFSDSSVRNPWRMYKVLRSAQRQLPCTTSERQVTLRHRMLLGASTGMESGSRPQGERSAVRDLLLRRKEHLVGRRLREEGCGAIRSPCPPSPRRNEAGWSR